VHRCNCADALTPMFTCIVVIVLTIDTHVHAHRCNCADALTPMFTCTGQYAVLYQGDQCLGAAQIDRCLAAHEHTEASNSIWQKAAAASGRFNEGGKGGDVRSMGEWISGVRKTAARVEGPDGGGSGAVVLASGM